MKTKKLKHKTKPAKPVTPVVSPTQGARRATGGGDTTGGGSEKVNGPVPDPEVREKKPRRRFTAKYKLQILDEASTLTKPGQIGALLRREGLYSSNLRTWRNQRQQGLLQAMRPKKRGRKPKQVNPLAKKVAQLERENRQLANKLRKAETIIDVQKKISELLGISQNPDENERNNS